MILPALAPQQQEYVSASRLKLWLRCPLSYKLRYIDGEVTPSNKNLFLGRVVHKALEVWYRYRQRDIRLFPEFIAEIILRNWSRLLDDELLELTSEETEELQQQAIGLLAAYLKSDCIDHEARPVAVEQRFQAELVDPNTGEGLGLPLLGFLDLVTEDGVIVDFKTAARSSKTVDAPNELQMSCYSYLYRAVTGKKERGLEIRSLIKTKVPKIEVHYLPPREPKDFERLFDVVRAYLDSVSRMHFYARPSFDCSWCDFRETLCGW